MVSYGSIPPPPPKKKKKTLIIVSILCGLLLLSGAFYLGRILVKNKPSEPKDNQPPSDNREIQQLKTDLNSVKSELNNLLDHTKKSQLESKLTEIESEVNEVARQNNYPQQSDIKKLEQQIKEIKEKLEKDKPDKNDNDDDNPEPSDKNELKVSFGEEGYSPDGELCFMFSFLEPKSTEEVKHFCVSKSHPRVKELLKVGKLQLDKKFTIRYKKVDSHQGKIYYFDGFNKDLEIIEV